jgi:hypothetical protein
MGARQNRAAPHALETQPKQVFHSQLFLSAMWAGRLNHRWAKRWGVRGTQRPRRVVIRPSCIIHNFQRGEFLDHFSFLYCSGVRAIERRSAHSQSPAPVPPADPRFQAPRRWRGGFRSRNNSLQGTRLRSATTLLPRQRPRWELQDFDENRVSPL